LRPGFRRRPRGTLRRARGAGSNGCEREDERLLRLLRLLQLPSGQIARHGGPGATQPARPTQVTRGPVPGNRDLSKKDFRAFPRSVWSSYANLTHGVRHCSQSGKTLPGPPDPDTSTQPDPDMCVTSLPAAEAAGTLVTHMFGLG